MIRVTVEYVPFGFEIIKSTLYTLEIANDCTGTHARGNYNVRPIGKSGRKLRPWRVENFPRRNAGAVELVRRALNAKRV